MNGLKYLGCLTLSIIIFFAGAGCVFGYLLTQTLWGLWIIGGIILIILGYWLLNKAFYYYDLLLAEEFNRKDKT